MKRLHYLFNFFVCVLLLSCHNERDTKEVIQSLSDDTSAAGFTGDSLKLVKTASIRFKVKDVEESSKAVSSLARKYGGMIYNNHLQSIEEGRNEIRISTDSQLVIATYSPQADIRVRVPSEHLEAFMFDAADLGYFTGSSNMDIEDKSITYLENALKAKSRTDILSNSIHTSSKPPTTLQKIGVKDQAIDQQLQNRRIDADVKYSTVDLALFQNPILRKEIIINTTIADYQLPLSQRFNNAITEGWNYFMNFFLVLAHLWMFILLGAAIYLSFRYWKQRKKILIFPVKAQ
jgi:hypothetical protein